jgi:hypothetical protein
MACRRSGILKAMAFDDLAYAIDEMRGCCRRQGNAFRRLRFRHVGSVLKRFADCSSVEVVAPAIIVVKNTVDASSASERDAWTSRDQMSRR